VIGATDEFGTALGGGVVQWVNPILTADWANDGVPPSGGIDDLTPYVAEAWELAVGLDDGLPSEVTAPNQLGPAELAVTLAGAPEWGTPAGRYFGAGYASSPLAGYARDVAPVEFSAGVRTAAGPERLAVFSGTMAGVDGVDTATLHAVSTARGKLAAPVAVPVVAAKLQGYLYGLWATWPISYLLHQCGVYPSPPARAGCILHIPFHGSLVPFAPVRSTAGGQPPAWVYRTRGSVPSYTVASEPRFVRGPWVSAVSLRSTTDELLRLYMVSLHNSSTLQLMSQSASAGRVEFWVRGDVVDAPISSVGALDYAGASTTFGTALTEFRYRCDSTASAIVTVTANRHMEVVLDDGGGHTLTVTSTDTIPEDGGWYFVGAAWSFSGKKAWVHLDGTTDSDTDASLSTAVLSATYDDLSTTMPSLASVLPLADFQVGNTNPDTDPWLSSYVWDRGADLYPSTLDLALLSDVDPTEAWSAIADYQQAETAYAGILASGMYVYRPRGYYATPSAMAANVEMSSETDIIDIVGSVDPSKILNSITVQYTSRSVSVVSSTIAEYAESLTVAGGATVDLVVSGSEKIVFANVGTVAKVDNSSASQPAAPYITLCTTSDGAGAYVTDSSVTVTVTSYSTTAVFVRIVNTTLTPLYLTNDKGWSALALAGYAAVSSSASTTVSDPTSVADRGLRSLSVSLNAPQTERAATMAATWILDFLCRPRVSLPTLTATWDPRVEPGDLAHIVDPVVTGVDGNWRVLGLRVTADGALHTVAVTTEPLIGELGVVVPDAAAEGAYPGGAIVDQTIVAADEQVLTPRGAIGKVVPDGVPEGSYPGGAIVDYTVVASG